MNLHLTCQRCGKRALVFTAAFLDTCCNAAPVFVFFIAQWTRLGSGDIKYSFNVERCTLGRCSHETPDFHV